MSSPPPSSSHPPPRHSDIPAVLSPAEITAALRDLTTAVQEICLFLAGPYGPPSPATLLLSSPPPDVGLLQSPLPLSTISGPGHTSALGVPLLQQSAAFFPTGTLQQQQQLAPPPTPPLQLLSSPTLSLPFGGQLQQQQLLSLPPTPQQWLLPPPTPSLPFGGVGATLAPGSTSTPPGMPFHQPAALLAICTSAPLLAGWLAERRVAGQTIEWMPEYWMEEAAARGAGEGAREIWAGAASCRSWLFVSAGKKSRPHGTAPC
nr:uncharacterized protein LOC127347462 [Lolium perenne]